MFILTGGTTEKGHLFLEGDMDLCSYARVWVYVCATRVRWNVMRPSCKYDVRAV